MLKDRDSIYIETIRKKWNERAKTYDKWYETFKGAVEHYVEWELLKKYLPKSELLPPMKAVASFSSEGRLKALI